MGSARGMIVELVLGSVSWSLSTRGTTAHLQNDSSNVDTPPIQGSSPPEEKWRTSREQSTRPTRDGPKALHWPLFLKQPSPFHPSRSTPSSRPSLGHGARPLEEATIDADI